MSRFYVLLSDSFSGGCAYGPQELFEAQEKAQDLANFLKQRDWIVTEILTSDDWPIYLCTKSRKNIYIEVLPEEYKQPFFWQEATRIAETELLFDE